jgi:fatty-acyl-CoA synthase
MVVCLSQGTTGQPKGATLSHHNLLNNSYFHGLLMGYHKRVIYELCVCVCVSARMCVYVIVDVCVCDVDDFVGTYANNSPSSISLGHDHSS